MILPQSLPEAMTMLGELVHDDRLAYGLAAFAAVLVVSGLLTWLLLGRVHR